MRMRRSQTGRKTRTVVELRLLFCQVPVAWFHHDWYLQRTYQLDSRYTQPGKYPTTNVSFQALDLKLCAEQV